MTAEWNNLAPGEAGDCFYSLYLEGQESGFNTLILIYFAFTSLSTVGFGDYTPASNAERILIALILLLGVSVFSYILGEFVSILDSWKSFNEL